MHVREREVREKSSIGPNIVSALRTHAKTRGLSVKELCARLDINPSTLSRWERGRTEPEFAQRDRAAKLLGVRTEQLSLPNEQFLRLFADRAPEGDWGFLFQSRMTERWRFLWEDVSQEFGGTYLTYVRLPRDGEEDLIAAAVFHILPLQRDRGIPFETVNIDDRRKDELGQEVIYRYSGLAFPVADTFLFIGEEDGCNEPLAIVVERPLKAMPMIGYILAVGVDLGRHYPMARRIFFLRRSREILHYRELRSEIGLFRESELPPTLVSNTLAPWL